MTDTAASRWDNLQTHRSIYLRRAIDCSKLTIPSLIPESDNYYGWAGQPDIKLKSLYQSVGARGSNGLSAKLLLALYPPSQPFFRLMVDKAKLDGYLQQTGNDEENVMSQLDIALSSMERQVLQKLDNLQARPALFEAIKHLVVGGNALLYVGEDSIRMYSLRSYCINRDPEGNVTEIVLKEQVAREYMPPGVVEDDEDSKDSPVDVYTWVQVEPNDDRVEWHQEYDGKKIPGSQGFSKLDSNPWLPLRLHRIAGESFGRSVVEECLGDLQALESLSQAIVEGSLIAAKALFLVNPNGVTRADALARAENGAIVSGNAADVESLQVQKNNDFATAMQTMQLIERRLNYTFLNDEAVQRDAERVTAEEIRLMAESLERGLGGIYSILAHELQLPLIKRVLHIMSVRGELPPLPKNLVSPQITTGLEAIGRGNDKARLTNFLQTVAAAVGPEQFLQYINPSELIRRFAASDGIDTAGLVKDEQELQAEQAQNQRLMLEQQLTEGAIRNGATSPTQPAAASNAGPTTPAAVPG